MQKEKISSVEVIKKTAYNKDIKQTRSVILFYFMYCRKNNYGIFNRSFYSTLTVMQITMTLYYMDSIIPSSLILQEQVYCHDKLCRSVRICPVKCAIAFALVECTQAGQNLNSFYKESQQPFLYNQIHVKRRNSLITQPLNRFE